jgi:hypothetical protein
MHAQKHFINFSPMRNYLILALFSLIQTVAFAQKDPVKRTVTTKTSIQKISYEQERWLRQNYQHIVSMKKDSARMEVKKSFPDASKTSVEAMINRASKLMQEDKQKHQAQAQQMIKSLTSQKNATLKQLAEKEKELKKTKDDPKIKLLRDEITVLKNKVKDLDKEIKYLHDSK